MQDLIWKPHATVAAVIERDDQYLLVEEIRDGARVLNQPAGHLEDRECMADAVVREVLEETAYHFQPEALVGCYRWRHPVREHTYLRLAFCGSVGTAQGQQALDEGIIAARWLRYDEIKNSDALRSPLVLQCIDDYRAGKRYPLEFLHDIE